MFLFEEVEKKGERGLAITGYSGKTRVLSVPECLENECGEKLPVLEIAAHAFDGREDLEKVELSKTIRALRAFSFFNCKALREFTLWDSVEDYYDGSLRQCLVLSHINVHFEKEENYQIVRDILGDSDRRLQFHLYFSESSLNMNTASVVTSSGAATSSREKADSYERNGTASSSTKELSLLFPGYVDKVREDTMARQIHDTIDGCGYSYRQTVGRRRIDLRLYDKLFSRAIHDTKGAAVYIALGRLRYPAELLDKAREDYLVFLSAEDCFSISLLISDEEWEWIEFYMDLQLFSEEAVKLALKLLAKYENAELAARFLDYQEKHFAKGQKKLLFDLDEL
ncbi:MAG: leucine-rich repeat protein [Oribacterium parvum]|uniref:Leucine-rich repeat protein n=1 Tax=Oribacterium parvum TaxID=1501329 RepID=A0A930H103_9FIRM|nr:leucine-rich repeat protein [Oribacterium parvum]